MDQFRFVVIIPTYLRVGSLARCLEALEKQTCLPDEIVVVRRDTDTPTAVFLEAYENKKNTIKIKVVSVKEAGYLPPVKIGLENAKGDYIGLIDDDVLVNPDWAEKAIKLLENNPRLGAVGGAALCKTKSGGSVYPARLWFGVRLAAIENINAINNKINGFAEGNVVFRGEAINASFVDMGLNIGGTAHHGLDIGLRMIKNGWKILYSPALNSEHLALRTPRADGDDEVKTYVSNLSRIVGNNFGRYALIKFTFYNLLIGQRQMPGIVYSFCRRVNWKNVQVAQNTLLKNIIHAIKQ